MRRILPCLLLPIITATYAESHSTDLLSQEAAQTTLASTEPTISNGSQEPASAPSSDVDVEKLTQSIAARLAELLGTETDPEQLTLSLETVVSSALRDGKQMDEIRQAVAQATHDVTGQELTLSDDATEEESTTATTGTGAAALSEAADTSDPDAIRTTTVLPGESLFTVAQRVYGEENGRRFLELFDANRDIIKDINVVHEGQVLKVP